MLLLNIINLNLVLISIVLTEFGNLWLLRLNIDSWFLLSVGTHVVTLSGGALIGKLLDVILIGCADLVVDVSQKIGVVILLVILCWSGPSHVPRLHIFQVGGTFHWSQMLDLLLEFIIIILDSAGSLVVSLNRFTESWDL